MLLSRKPLRCTSLIAFKIAQAGPSLSCLCLDSLDSVWVRDLPGRVNFPPLKAPYLTSAPQQDHNSMLSAFCPPLPKDVDTCLSRQLLTAPWGYLHVTSLNELKEIPSSNQLSSNTRKEKLHNNKAMGPTNPHCYHHSKHQFISETHPYSLTKQPDSPQQEKLHPVGKESRRPFGKDSRKRTAALT